MDLAYLHLLTRSFISTTKELGILEKFEFAPDGRTLKAKIHDNIVFNDGTLITAQDVAESLIKALPHKPLGKRVQIDFKWARKGYKIIAPGTFEVKFRSEIKNLTGVVREALSTGSSPNRIWVIKEPLSNLKVSNPIVATKYPFYYEAGAVVLKLKHHEVILIAKGDCRGSDLTLYPEDISNEKGIYETKTEQIPRFVSLQLNSSKLTGPQRLALTGWIRSTFLGLSKSTGFFLSDSFFAPGENGFAPHTKWPNDYDSSILKNRTWKISAQNNYVRSALSKAAQKMAIRIQIIPPENDRGQSDARILNSGIIDGRHLILQDALSHDHAQVYLSGAPLTKAALQEVAKYSASTVPPDTEILQKFEIAARSECAFVPLARKHSVAYSRKNLPVSLEWDQQGELYLKEND